MKTRLLTRRNGRYFARAYARVARALARARSGRAKRRRLYARDRKPKKRAVPRKESGSRNTRGSPGARIDRSRTRLRERRRSSPRLSRSSVDSVANAVAFRGRRGEIKKVRKDDVFNSLIFQRARYDKSSRAGRDCIYIRVSRVLSSSQPKSRVPRLDRGRERHGQAAFAWNANHELIIQRHEYLTTRTIVPVRFHRGGVHRDRRVIARPPVSH